MSQDGDMRDPRSVPRATVPLGVAQARAEQPASILMDLMLPLLDGVSASERLKADPHAARIPIIAMSAGTNLVWVAERVRVERLLSKPSDLDTLLAHITMLLETTGAGAPAMAAGA